MNIILGIIMIFILYVVIQMAIDKSVNTKLLKENTKLLREIKDILEDKKG